MSRRDLLSERCGDQLFRGSPFGLRRFVQCASPPCREVFVFTVALDLPAKLPPCRACGADLRDELVEPEETDGSGEYPVLFVPSIDAT